MDLRTTLFLLVLAVVASVGVEMSLTGRHAWFVGDRNQPFATYRKEFFREIHIERESDAVALSGVGSEWFIHRPIEFPARLSTIERLIRTIRHLRIRGEIGPYDGGYGIAESRLKVSFVDGSGTRRQLAFGDEIQVGSNRYVYFEADGQVSWCDVTARDALRDVTVTELRDDALTTVFAGQAEKLVIERGDGAGRTVVENVQDSGWRVVEPYVTEAAPEEVVHTIAVLNAWGIDDYVLDGVLPENAPQDLGFNPPRYRIEIHGVSGARDVLLVGADVPAEAGGEVEFTYVAWEGKPFVFRALRDPVILFERDPDAFRSRDLFSLPDPEVEWVEIVGDTRVRVELTGANREKMTVDGGSETYPVDRDYLVQIVERLRNAKVQEFTPRAGDLQAQGLGLVTPDLIVRIKSKDGDVEELRVGRTLTPEDAESRGGVLEGFHYVWNRRWEGYFAVAEVPLGRLLWTAPYSLRSPTVHDLPMPAVGRISLQVPGSKPIAFERATTAWIVAGDRKLADMDDTNRLLTYLYTMVAIEWRPRRDGDPGPDAYELKAEVGRPGMGSTTFWVGPEIPGQPGDRWVRYDDSDWVFLYRTGDVKPNPVRFLILSASD